MTAPSRKSCVRCGIQREARRTTALCKSCADVLTRPERKAWQ